MEKYRQAYKDERDKRDAIDYKLTIASEQRKVLIKEVKSLQLDLDECNDANDRLCEMNEQMEVMIERLRSELERQSKTIKEHVLNPSIENKTFESTSVDVDNNSIEIFETVKKVIIEESHVSEVAEEVSNSFSPNDETNLDETLTKESEEISSIEKALEDARVILQKSREVRGNVILDENEGENAHSRSAAIQPITSSPPITTPPIKPNPAILATPASSTASVGDGSRRYSISSILNVEAIADILPEKLKHFGASESTNDGTSVSTIPGNNSSSIGPLSSTGNGSGIRKTSIKLFSDIFNKDENEEVAGSTPATANSDTLQTHPSHLIQSGEGKNDISDDSYYRPSGVPICYRCSGTVEGPKYSTCKCNVPQLTPGDDNGSGGDKVHHHLGSFKNMINKRITASQKAIRKASITSMRLMSDNEGGNQLPVLFDPDDV